MKRPIDSLETPRRIFLHPRSLLTVTCLLACLFIISFPVDAATIFVPPCGGLQDAINRAKFGDIIILQANGTYTTVNESFVLPYKGVGTGTDADYITIQTSNMGGISADGQRIDPQLHSVNMARLVTGSGYSVLTVSPG